MAKVVIVQELDSFKEGQTRCLVTDGKDFYVVSTLKVAFDTGKPETLAFRSNVDGEVDCFDSVAGGINKTREDCIIELEARITTNSLDSAHGEQAEEWLENGGFEGLINNLFRKE